MKGCRQLCRFIPVTLVMVTIFILSHQEGSSLSLPSIPYLDKLAHFLAYALLAATALYALPGRLRKRPSMQIGAWVGVFCLVYGITDELHQAFIPERVASFSDLAADLLGAVLIIFIWYRRRSRSSVHPFAPAVPEHPESGSSSGVL